ncbi:hypothetical protein [Azospirillum largimobile]
MEDVGKQVGDICLLDPKAKRPGSCEPGRF